MAVAPAPTKPVATDPNRDTALIVCRALLMIVRHLNKRYTLGLRLGDD